MKDFAKKDWLLEVQGWSKWFILWHSFLAVEFIKKIVAQHWSYELVFA